MRAIPLLLLLAACAPTYMWTRDNTTQADFKADVAKCDYEASLATAGYGTSQTVRGYGGAVGQGFGEGIAAAAQKGDLMTRCMLAKGYSQKPLR